MKTTTASVQNTGNLAELEAEEVGFDEESFGPLMTILSNLYTNKAEAVIREYSANAYDSHIAAGNAAPICVTLPTPLAPTFVVQDFGLGLSKTEILKVYGRYGKSTKRNSNDQIGGFGIGAKAAFALGQQFIVTGVKGGVRTVVLFALNERNIGQMTVISESLTDDPNGVTVSLAVEDIDHFNTEATHFFSKWDRGTVLLNGEEPSSLFDTALQINNTTQVVLNTYNNGLFLRMGQIAYHVNASVLDKMLNLEDLSFATRETAISLRHNAPTSALYLSAPIGSAEVAPNREALIDSAQTINTLKDLLEELSSSLEVVAQSLVDASPSAWQAARALYGYRKDIRPLKVSEKLTFNGRTLNQAAPLPTNSSFLARANNRVKRSQVSFMDVVDDPKKILFLPETPHTSVLRAASRILSETDYSRILLLPTDVMGISSVSGWFSTSEVTTLSHSEFKALVKDLRNANPVVRAEAAYSVNEPFSRERESRILISEIIEEGLPVAITGPEGISLNNKYLKTALEKVNVIALGGNQSLSVLQTALSKGNIEVLNIKDLYAAAEEMAKADFDVTPEEAEALGASDWITLHKHSLRYWDEILSFKKDAEEDGLTIENSAVLDILETIELAYLTANQISSTRKSELRTAARVISSAEYITPFDAEVPKVEDVLPLLHYLGSYTMRAHSKDVIAYVNAKG